MHFYMIVLTSDNNLFISIKKFSKENKRKNLDSFRVLTIRQFKYLEVLLSIYNIKPKRKDKRNATFC